MLKVEKKISNNNYKNQFSSYLKKEKLPTAYHLLPTRVLLIVSFLFILSYDTFSQIDYSFSGYVVDLPVYALNQGDLAKLFSIDQAQFLNLTRIRLRPEVFLWSGARMNIEYEADVLYSKQNSFLFLNQTSTNRQIVKLKWNLFDRDNIDVSHYIDRLYLRQGFRWGNIIIGRQRIAWGVGRVWSPTDLFNPINPANFGQLEKTGVDAASFTYSFGNFTDLNIVYNPQEKLAASNAGFRFRTNFAGFDYALVGGYFDKRLIAGGNFAGNFFDAGIRGEGIISMDKNNINDNFIKFVLGMDNQFTSKLYALFEYQFNGEGKTNKLNYDLLGLINGRIINLSQNYLIVSGSYLLTPLLTTTLANNWNLNDGSGYVNLSAAYSATENATITLGIFLRYGSQFTEYWYYPDSYYLEGQWFF